MTKTITKNNANELKKDYNKEKLCNYFCSLCELKYIDLFDPFIFWQFVKMNSLTRDIEIKIRNERFGKNRYYVRLTRSGTKGEYFSDMEYGILYMITKDLKKQIDNVRIGLLKHPEAKIDYTVWEKYKKDITDIAFNSYLIRNEKQCQIYNNERSEHMQARFIKKLWHTNRKQFINEFSIMQTLNSDGEYEHTYLERNSKDMELISLPTCQIREVCCTGLKDKNGKLIYDGDILKLNTQGEILINYGVVFFDEEKACFLRTSSLQDSKKIGVSFWYNKSIEVIGNIYENPELLENNQ